MGNDKLRFDFISRGDDRHRWRNRGCKEEKKENEKSIVRSKLLFTYSINEQGRFPSNNTTLCYFALVYNIDI